jgi:hypothetical protein
VTDSAFNFRSTAPSVENVGENAHETLSPLSSVTMRWATRSGRFWTLVVTMTGVFLLASDRICPCTVNAWLGHRPA